VRLPAQAGGLADNRIGNRSLDHVVEGVVCGVQAVLRLQKQIESKTRQPALELVVQDQVGIRKPDRKGALPSAP